MDLSECQDGKGSGCLQEVCQFGKQALSVSLETGQNVNSLRFFKHRLKKDDHR